MNTTEQKANEVRYTPGPWNKSSVGRSLYIASESDFVCDMMILEGETDPANRGVLNANASLIAAAPELLEACKRFVDYYAGNKAAWLGNGQAHKSLDEFRAAIAKAEGRQ